MMRTPLPVGRGRDPSPLTPEVVRVLKMATPYVTDETGATRQDYYNLDLICDTFPFRQIHCLNTETGRDVAQAAEGQRRIRAPRGGPSL
ncbi:partner of Y14 and mago isoform X4 [Mastomys coucha]|uniref:partner of Y14 and mago isoform X4 n=1 Tax=Mastomys coucha TaxID=35658 RepID=UPI00126222E2|nr:partner of Y14 and mago isoform X4 [Mastomys coucha]